MRWRLIDLRDEIDREFGVQLHERSVGQLLARLKFSRVSVRPRHPEQDAHTKTLANSLQTSSQKRRAANQSSSGGRMKPGSASKAA